MAQTTEGATESVEAVQFSFMTAEEVREHSFLKITNPFLLDHLDRPTPGGLYDPIMGPLEDRAPCKTCGQTKLNCPGHCGHIDLVSPVYNPLMFTFLYNMLQRTCLFCYHFKADPEQVKRCVSQLELIAKGDVAGARKLDPVAGDKKKKKDSYSVSVSEYPEDSEGSHTSCSTVHSNHADENYDYLQQQKWTSLQFTEAMSILNKFLKLKFTKCNRCMAKSPILKKPTFGWLHMSNDKTGANARENVMRGIKTRDTFSGEAGSEVEDTDNIAIYESDADDPNAGRHGGKGGGSKDHKRNNAEVLAEFMRQRGKFSGPLLPSEVKNIIKLLWENEVDLCSFITDIQQQGFGNKAGHSMFFLETVLVPPIKFRAPTKGGDSVMEHPQTVLLNKVLQSNIALGNANTSKSNQSRTIVSRWMELQQSINVLFDTKTATGPGRKDVGTGICQLLEKKEGMFRQKMMGKRVNFACRSVISPDPYLAVNEIGIPPYFALRLTYPEKVTPWNMAKLREAIINGSEIHPGATQYIDKLSTHKLPPSRKARISISRKLPSSRGAVIQPGKNSDFEFEGKTVLRHLQDGDVVLVNRQPTLHKPSIMAHIVRVLKGEKTIRMHYANCSTYNADFDGDEMNVHFPQDEISRAEAYNIVNANNQYCKPSNGDPIRALIQDHILSAALLTKKDTFLSRDEFNQLLYSSGISSLGSSSSSGKPGQKVIFSSSEEETLPILPAIWKPVPLWTGKQVITAMLNHITSGRPPFTVEKAAKLPGDFFKRKSREVDRINKGGDVKSKIKEPDEDKLLIYKNDLVRGVIDKAQFADYGLVHTVQELYGSNTAGSLLSVFSRLFTVFLQMHGFTCGVDDLLIMKDKDVERKKQLEDCERKVTEAHYKLFGGDDGAKIEKRELEYKIENTIRFYGEAAVSALDRKVTKVLNENSSRGVLSDLLTEGLLKSTGKNCISLMTTSGAKGSKVNFQQISAFLGQQELEGKRVPRMVSGKTLPCFHPWDWEARAGGFISDRFLSGLRPQEYYFHCMAGREGLVDTAVKTSRSGYLQRCLIKNLECLKVSYDYTVRDADGSIVQFQYGEDGVDVHQTSFITKFEALALNQDMLSEKFSLQLREPNKYITDLPKRLRKKADEFIDGYSLKGKGSSHPVKRKHFLKLMKHKFFASLAQPGEPVGVLASQSVGEPSTQMTLNTFHLAGRGEMNVTLGIPRLQEILMTASADIKTPLMTCPLQEGKTKEDAMRLADKLKKITVADIVESAEASVSYADSDGRSCRVYKLRMKLCKTEQYPKYTDTTVEDWQDILEGKFLRELEDAIETHVRLLSRISGIKNFVPESQPNASDETDEDVSGGRSHSKENDDDGDDADNDDKAEDLGLDAKKQKRQVTDEMDYEESEEEQSEGGSVAGSESETGQSEDEDGIIENDATGLDEGMDGISESQPNPPNTSKSKSGKRKTKLEPNKKKKRSNFTRKKNDRSIFCEATGCDCDQKREVHQMHYEVHFEFKNEDPHILLAEIAKKTADKVYIQSSGKINQCQVIDCSENQVLYYGRDPNERRDVKADEKKKIPALHSSGIDFRAFWDMQDHLDLRYLYCNDIHAMLNTYGVEAARETIIREINNVFTSYGISVNIRHLTLIADFMTHSGGYRPMSRLGAIADSVSPFSKMSFETASRFIVEAAKHWETDNLETPSARICLGLPIKMGTGSFDLMQRIEV
ncbi:hypothetical protein SLA2020_139020 [Shorea laevis]